MNLCSILQQMAMAIRIQHKHRKFLRTLIRRYHRGSHKVSDQVEFTDAINKAADYMNTHNIRVEEWRRKEEYPNLTFDISIKGGQKTIDIHSSDQLVIRTKDVFSGDDDPVHQDLLSGKAVTISPDFLMNKEILGTILVIHLLQHSHRAVQSFKLCILQLHVLTTDCNIFVHLAQTC